MHTRILFMMLIGCLLSVHEVLSQETPFPVLSIFEVVEGNDHELLDQIKTLSFGEVPLNGITKRYLKVRNDEAMPVHIAVSLEEDYEHPFTQTSGPSSVTLAPAESVEFEFTCQITEYGNPTVTFIIEIPWIEGVYVVRLNSQTPAPPRPIITLFTPHHLMRVGDYSSIDTGVVGAPPLKYTWFKNGVAVLGKTEDRIEFDPAEFGDAGVYQMAVTSGTNEPEYTSLIYAGAIKEDTRPLGLRLGDKMDLRCEATAPKGPDFSLSWQWMREGIPLTNGRKEDDSTVTGAQASHLQIAPITAAVMGHYSCRVAMRHPEGEIETVTTGQMVQVITEVPIVEEIVMPSPLRVGQPVEAEIIATNSPKKYSARGLPRGLRLDSKTGQIDGRPLQFSSYDPSTESYKPFKVIFQASNYLGKSEPVELLLTILPIDVDGHYSGLIGRNAQLNQNLGGRIDCTITKTGQVSGRLRMAGKSYPFKTQLDTLAESAEAFNGSVLIRRKPPFTSNLYLILNHTESSLQEEGSSEKVTVSCQKLSQAADFSSQLAGDYTAGFSSSSSHAEGFARIKIRPSGTTSLIGRAGDGSAFTCASSMEFNSDQFLIHSMLDKDQGSLQGVLGIAWITNDLYADTSRIPLDWVMLERPMESKDRIFKEGFPVTNLSMRGGRYSKHYSYEPLLGLYLSPSAWLSFYGNLNKGVEPFSLGVAIQLSGKIILPNSDHLNPNAISLKLSGNTGLFSGKFQDEVTKRKGSFAGVLVNHFESSTQRSYGQFLLPLGDGQTSPIHVGRMSLEP